MFVNVNFHKNSGKVAETVRYIAHREETLPEGHTREIYGIGTRYRELRGDEAAIVNRLRGDAAGLKEPHFFRLKFTVDDEIARRILLLPRPYAEWAIRGAVEKTFDGALRRGQGAFVVHYHGGARRPYGHPHAHVVLSPRYQDGAALQFIPRVQLVRIKERWEREIGHTVQRFERRALTPESQRVLKPDVALARLKTFAGRLAEAAARRAATETLGRPASTLFRSVKDARQLAHGGPMEIFKRRAPKLAELLAPAPLRIALRAARVWGRLIPGGGDRSDD
jgi:hypothetical protein